MNNKWICEACGDTNMPVLYDTVSGAKVCNPCTKEDKWVGNNHFKVGA